jgi:hypothetical protein
VIDAAQRVLLSGRADARLPGEIPVPDEGDFDQVLRVGDLSMFADLGLEEMDVAAICSRLDFDSESGDRPELIRDKQCDQFSKLLSAQFDLVTVVIYKRDWHVSECGWGRCGRTRNSAALRIS